MQYQQLGKSSLRVSRIGFGCMSLRQDEAANVDLLHKALDLGINYFDTADLYDKGANEILVGRALREKRKDIILATKVGNQWRADGSGWDWNPDKTYILRQAEESLTRLGTDYIDLYQLHGGTINDPIDETIEAFEILLQQGKIRYYGISSIRPNVIREWVKRSQLVSVMMQYSLLDRRPEESILSFLKDQEIGVVARGSLAQGLLANKPEKAYLDHTKEQVEQLNEITKSLTNKVRGKSHVALLYVLRHPAITSAVTGFRTMEQMMEAIKALSVPQLTDEEFETLLHSLPPNFYQEHR